jgi:tetratricopeptide (TPR) repeat protein
MLAQMEPQVEEKLLETAAELMPENLPQDQKGDMRKCARLLRHAIAALKYTYVGHRHPNFKMHRDLQHAVGNALGDMGVYGGALEWYQQPPDDWEKTLGKDHPDKLTTISNTAGALDSQGQHEKALEW